MKNVITDDGTLIPIDLSFDSMESFEPAEVVKKIPELAVLLDARSQLKELLTYMDGKVAAEELIEQLLKDLHLPADDAAAPGDAVQADGEAK
ncbi:type VI secretion system contractile sheath small subunit [Chromobacterium haemolyticum]|nr:type VI secretion system contractile sheath small subunit [Chromobacterium haemolyticum]